MNRLRKKNIANIAAGTSIIATKLAARVRFRKIRNGSSGCSTRRLDEREDDRAATTPATRVAMVQRVAPAVRVPAARVRP